MLAYGPWTVPQELDQGFTFHPVRHTPCHLTVFPGKARAGSARHLPQPARLRPSPLPPLCPDSAALHPSRPGATPSHQLSHLAPIVFSPILPLVLNPPSHLQYWRAVPQDYELVFMGKHCHGVPHMHTS